MIEKIHLIIAREIDLKGSLTAAATALNITQSAVTHTIKKLESRLGTELFNKKGRQLHFTPAGKHLLKEANRILPQLERTEEVLREFATGEYGTLKIGMECHPCYQWLLKVVKPYLARYKNVDIDIRQQFKFGGMAALFNYEIDILVTPDPLLKPGIEFVPVFNYEQVLVVPNGHALTHKQFVEPQDLVDQVLYTYPVETERLDIFSGFLLPAHCRPRRHKVIETTEMILELVAAQRGVATLPEWLVKEYMPKVPIQPLRLGLDGIQKQIHLGFREDNHNNDQARQFLEMAKL